MKQMQIAPGPGADQILRMPVRRQAMQGFAFRHAWPKLQGLEKLLGPSEKQIGSQIETLTFPKFPKQVL